MHNLAMPELATSSAEKLTLEARFFIEASISDADHFIEALSKIRKKGGIPPDVICHIITHYASKWLPDLTVDPPKRTGPAASPQGSPRPQQSATATWMKRRLVIENLVGILPPEKEYSGAIPCDLLLRLLRAANSAGVGSTFRDELEDRVARRLDEASLAELVMPSFSHTCATLLDFGLVLRLVRRFLADDEDVSTRSGAKLAKVAKLVDSYLAEAAVDSQLSLSEFIALAGALPSHARSMDDGLYRAIDTYLKAHPGMSKQERKRLCRLIDSRKLSAEASNHAAQNERLPVRAVIQVLLSEQTKLSKHVEWSGSLSGTRSPGVGPDNPLRCFSKREMSTQLMEIKRLKEDVLRLQSQCMNMEMQIEMLLEEKRMKKKKKGYFSWKNIGITPPFKANKIGQVAGGGAVFGGNTPVVVKARPVGGGASNKWSESFY